MGLLGRAKNLMQGWSAPPPSRAHPFNVACSEGHRLQGLRTEGYQALRCPTCGEGIFVLPRSPLPEPPLTAGTPKARVTSAIEAAYEDEPIPLTDPIPGPSSEVADPVEGGAGEPVEIDWVDGVPEAPASAVVDVTPPHPPKKRPVSPLVGRPASVPAPSFEPASAFSLRDWGWRHRNRLLVVGLLVLVVSAVAVRRGRQKLESLPQVAEIGRTIGLKKLDEGDFQAAKKLLADAAAAVDALGGSYEGAGAIRQGSAEAAIFTDLASEGLDQILENASTFQVVKDWTAHFATFYKGRSVILETVVTAVPDPAKPGGRYQVGTYLFAGRGPRPTTRASIDLTGFRLFELSEPKVGDIKTFGARLASLELDPNTSVWVYTLEPESGVYITHSKALEKVFGSSDGGEEVQP